MTTGGVAQPAQPLQLPRTAGPLSVGTVAAPRSGIRQRTSFASVRRQAASPSAQGMGQLELPLRTLFASGKLFDFQPVTVEEILEAGDQGAIQALSTGPDSDVATETGRRSARSSAGCHVQHVTDDWEASVC